MIRSLGLMVLAFVASVAVAQGADPALSPAANTKFLADHAKIKGEISRPDGLQYRIIQNGSGKHPALTDKVEVLYTGTLINGEEFDGTEEGFSRVFEVQNLIAGWKEALLIMREGDHWQLIIPPDLAYGARGSQDGSIPPGQDLVFDLHLLRVVAKSPEEVQREQAEKAQEEDAHPGPGAGGTDY